MNISNLPAFAVGFIVGCGFIITLNDCNRNSYECGQIDALTGKVRYELKQQPSGETVWVEKTGDGK